MVERVFEFWTKYYSGRFVRELPMSFFHGFDLAIDYPNADADFECVDRNLPYF